MGERHLRVYKGGYEHLGVGLDKIPGRIGPGAVGEGENMILAFFFNNNNWPEM